MSKLDQFNWKRGICTILKICLFLVFSCCLLISSWAQSIEVMPGTQRLFVDVQFLRFIDQERKVSLFSRTRVTADYNARAANDLFIGAYLNYTGSSGIGITLVGRISMTTRGADVGIHYFHANEHWLVYALASASMNGAMMYSWFSITRFTWKIGSKGYRGYLSGAFLGHWTFRPFE